MITMNQVDAGSESNFYGAIRMLFGAAMIGTGALMAVAALMAGGAMNHLLMVLLIAAFCAAVGGGMLARQAWARWGFYLVSGMMVLGAAEAALRAQVLERNAAWDRPLALVVGLFFGWGLWMMTRPLAKEEWAKDNR